MDYNPRFDTPEPRNKYYNRIQNGGYSTCIQGNTKMSCYTSTLNVLPNCVGYAMGRFNEIGNYKSFKYTFKGNAEDWFTYAKSIGLKTGNTPKLGAVICWRAGKVGLSSDGPGHVAIVEQLNSDGSIVTSESGWSVNKLFWTTRRKKNSNWDQSKSYTFQGFIYNPAVEDDEPSYLKRGSTGEAVKQLQHSLNTFGWYDLKEDGIFGLATEKAVKDMQTKLGLEVDGIYGSESEKALSTIIEQPKNVDLIPIIFNNKNREVFGVNIDGQNYVRLVDIYYQMNLAKVKYDSNKKKPIITK